MKTIIAFLCDFCPPGSPRRRAFTRKGNATRHEARCYYNPATRSCASCANFTEETETSNYGKSLSRGCEAEVPEFWSEDGTVQLNTNCSEWKPRPEVAA